MILHFSHPVNCLGKIADVVEVTPDELRQGDSVYFTLDAALKREDNPYFTVSSDGSWSVGTDIVCQGRSPYDTSMFGEEYVLDRDRYFVLRDRQDRDGFERRSVEAMERFAEAAEATQKTIETLLNRLT